MVGLPCGTVVDSGSVLQGSEFSWVGLGLVLATLVETYLQEDKRAGLEMPSPARVLQSKKEVKAEISWRGFAQLYSACVPGEGEKFSRKVLGDTLQVVASCQGELESGSEHRGVYTFPNAVSRRECHLTLQEYGRQLDGVLAAVEAPAVTLFFKEV